MFLKRDAIYFIHVFIVISASCMLAIIWSTLICDVFGICKVNSHNVINADRQIRN